MFPVGTAGRNSEAGTRGSSTGTISAFAPENDKHEKENEKHQSNNGGNKEYDKRLLIEASTKRRNAVHFETIKKYYWVHSLKSMINDSRFLFSAAMSSIFSLIHLIIAIPMAMR